MTYSEDDFTFDYFDPKQLSPTLEPGDGKFLITQVVPKISKGQNKMLEFTFEVTDSNDKKLTINDWLVATPGDSAGMKRLATKIRNIANSIGKPELYAEGRAKVTPIDFVGHKGLCIIKTQTSDNYSDRSIIAKYIEKASEPVAADIDDDLPF